MLKGEKVALKNTTGMFEQSGLGVGTDVQLASSAAPGAMELGAVGR
jgi:hypothetical protein